MKELIGAVLIVTTIVLFFAGIISFLNSLGTDCLPISGRVIEKLEIHNGYGSVSHALRLEVAEERYVNIAVSGKVYMLVVENVYYEFDGSKGGTSYDSVTRDED